MANKSFWKTPKWYIPIILTLIGLMFTFYSLLKTTISQTVNASQTTYSNIISRSPINITLISISINQSNDYKSRDIKIDTLKMKESLDKKVFSIDNLDLDRLKMDTSYTGKSEMLIEDQSGFSIYSVLFIKKPKINKPKYIFDFGYLEDTNRVSVFFDKNNLFNFRIIDRDSNIYKIQLSKNKSEELFNKKINLSCTLNTINNLSSMKVLIDGKELNHQQFNRTIYLDRIKISDVVVGSNLNKVNHAELDIYEILAYEETLTKEEEAQIQDYFNSIGNDKKLTFKGKVL